MEQNENLNQNNQENEEKKKSLQSDDKEVLEQRNPKEGSDAISDAGKRRQEGERYQ